MFRTSRIIVFLFLYVSVHEVQSQDNQVRHLEVRGFAELDMKPVARATANLYEGTNKVKSIQTDSYGSFSFKLEINRQYTVEIEKEGLAGKRILFDTRMPDNEKGTWVSEFSMGFVKPCGNIDYSVLNQPVDKISFNPDRREFVSDREYMNSMRPKIEALLQKTDQCIKDERDKENKFSQAITKGGVAYTKKDYGTARQYYQQALQIKPGEALPEARLKEIEAIEAVKAAEDAARAIALEQAARQKEAEDVYKKAIGAANTAIAKKAYTQAKEHLKKALELKPGDAYATTKTAEVDRLILGQQQRLEQEQQLAKQYNDLIASGDKLFSERDYNNARTAYSKALQLKPSDSYACQKIASIENIVAAEQVNKKKQTDEAYSTAMTRGSNFLVAKDLKAAGEAFREALTIKPGDVHAGQKLAETELIMKQEHDKAVAEQERKEKYEKAIGTGDGYLAQKNYHAAKESYQKALEIMPGESYPRQKLNEAVKAIEDQEKILTEKRARDNAYSIALANADKYYKAKDYALAKDEYVRAMNLKPKEEFPDTKIKEIENLIAAREKEMAETKARVEGYTVAINAGNGALGKKEYSVAREHYTEALKFMPNDPLAADHIKKIDHLLAEAEKMRKNDEAAKVAVRVPVKSTLQGGPPVSKVASNKALNEMRFRNEAEKQVYLKELTEKYPPGITLEKYREKYREIYRYVIIRNNEAQEFRYIRFTTYNDAQYWVNGKPITQQYFASQTKVRDGESFKEIDMQ